MTFCSIQPLTGDSERCNASLKGSITPALSQRKRQHYGSIEAALKVALA
jgi:hypothetical protein